MNKNVIAPARLLLAWAVLCSLAWGAFPAWAGPDALAQAAPRRVLVVDSSSMPVTAGKVTLIIGEMQRVGTVFRGKYQIKVTPYFFKNQDGTLAIIVPDKAMAELTQGKQVAVVGTATTSGKDGETRRVDAVATPADLTRGAIKIWFMVGDRKMTFEPTYHFDEVKTASISPLRGSDYLAVRIAETPQ